MIGHRRSCNMRNMRETLAPRRRGHLEGLCELPTAGRGDKAAIRQGWPCRGIERMEARFRGRPFSPHRHDTYAIGITLSGIQTFRYRGRQWHCRPGQWHILHPDELHDGAAGTDEGFAYRIAYIDPALIQQALGGRPLPFVANPVGDLSAFRGNPPLAAWDMDAEIDEFEAAEIAAALADMLSAAAGGRRGAGQLRLQGLLRVRDFIAATACRRHSLDELERIAGLDRWSLARQFRAAFGTSPSRFRTMRQLDYVRGMVRQGLGLAESALAAGFADQSHMSRHFKRAYGFTPARWAAALV